MIVINIFVDGQGLSRAGDGNAKVLALAVVPLHWIFQGERKYVFEMVLDELHEAVERKSRSTSCEAIDELVFW